MSNPIPAENESLSSKVVTEVATAKGVSPIDAPPLYDTIDPEALDTLFDGVSRTGHVSFSYNGCDVSVKSTGEVQVSNAENIRIE